jgi:hypothetical protein
MSKLILLLSLLAVALMFALGMTDPNSPAMWMASTSINFAFLRLVMMAVLASLLVTHPPRNVYMRMVIGVFAGLLTTWALWTTYENSMKLLDTMAILLFSVSAGLSILESKFLLATHVESEEERLEAARAARRQLLNA